MPSTNSSTATTQPPRLSEAELDEESLRDALSTAEGVRRLGVMAGIKSIHRNLKNEDAADERARRIFERDILDCDMPTGKQDDDPMEVMAARDVIVNYGSPAQAQQPSPNQPAPTPTPAPSPAVTPTPNGLSNLAKVAIVGSSLLGAGGLATGIASYFNKPTTTINNPPSNFDPNDYDISGSVTPL